MLRATRHSVSRGLLSCICEALHDLARDRTIFRLVLIVVVILASVSRSRSYDLVEERGFLRVSIGGEDVRLESLVVKRTDADGRLPVALITHGKPYAAGATLDVHATGLAGQARDLARRGWLAVVVVRRGYGQSDGPLRIVVSCKNTSLAEQFRSEADDLLGALEFIARRPDADPTRAIAIGGSGGGAAVSALSARNPKNLLGVANISGGLRIQGCAMEDALVAAFKELGETSRIPNLWVYAQNDSFFSPHVVQQMRTAFLDGGGDVKLVMFDPIGADGHAMFNSTAGRVKWLMELDGFLRFHGLPTWQRRDVDALIEKVKSDDRRRAFFEGYIAAPSEKALAQSAGGDYWHSTFGYKAIDDARNRAVELCQQKKPGEQCAIVMENDHWIGGAM